MEYTKPEFLAQNSAEGSFAAGCPDYDRGRDKDLYMTIDMARHFNQRPCDPPGTGCLNCERTK